MEARLQELITEVDGLIDAVRAEESRASEAISRVAENHRDGAVNLVHYAELRQHDIRSVQGGLASIGATRLSTAEPPSWPASRRPATCSPPTTASR